MRRFVAFALMIPLFSLLAAFGSGCGPSEPPAPPKRFVAPKPEKKTALEVTGLNGVLHGKVVFDGEPPSREYLTRIDDHPDKVGCLKGGPSQTSNQTWVVSPETKAVANIVVWLEPPKGRYFVLRENDKGRDGDIVVLDQPHCAFVPHVATVFPSFFDGEKQVKTGQKFRIKNSAPFLHSIQWNASRENDGVIATIPINGGHQDFELNPEKGCLAIGCGIHNWMHGIVWIFDHPYHAVTKSDGAFQIGHLPTGVELTFKAWHESAVNPFAERKITLQPGANTSIDLTIKSRKR